MFILEKNSKFYIKQIIQIIFSILGTYGIINAFELNSNAFATILFILILISYNFASINYNLRNKKTILTILYTIMMCIVFVIGRQLDLTGKIEWKIETLQKLVFCFLAFLPIIYLLISKIDNFILKRIEINEKKLSFISFGILFLFNLLVFLAVYPGIWGYDSIYEYNRVVNGTMDTNYSVMYCYILGGSINLGYKLFNSASIGYSIYIFLQMLFMTICFNKVVIYVYNKTKSLLLYIISIIFFSLNILVKVLVNSSTQDVLFGGIFILLVLNLFRLVTDTEEYFSKKSNLIELLVLEIFLCFARNNGTGTIIITTIFLLFLKISKERKIKLFTTIICGLLMYNIIFGPIFNLIGIKNNSITYREISSIPTQQLARALAEDKENMTEETINEYKKYYGNIDELIKWSKKAPSISDNLKKQLIIKNVKDDLGGYIKLWLEVGINHKKAYIEAFGMQTLGLWVPNKIYPDDRAYHPIVEYENVNTKVAYQDKNNNYLPIDRQTKFKIYDTFLEYWIYNNNWTNLPIYSFVLGQSFYLYVLILTIFVCILRKNKRILIALSPVIAIEFMMFFSPVALYRYIFPVVISFPLMLMTILDKELIEKKKD